MAKVELISGGQKVENVIIGTPQPMSPAGALPPDIGWVEISTSDDRGSIWTTGEGNPTDPAGQAGDMYLDMDTGDVWRWDGDEWILQGTFAPSTDTPAEVLAKIIQVDGPGSLLDADTLDGMDSTDFATQVDMDAAEVAIAGLDTRVDGTEAVNTQQNIDIDAVEADNDAQDIAIAGKANAVHTHPQSDIINLVADLALKAPLASPVFTGNPTAPTPSLGDADTSLATTAFVSNALADFDAFPEAPVDGLTYGRKDAAWATIVGGAIVSDTPPVGPAPGQMWYEADSGNTYIWYSDADSSQWVQQNIAAPITGLQPGLTAETRNRLVNPAMQISQENGNTGGGLAVTLAHYCADQWNTLASTSPGTAMTQRIQAVTPNGSKDRVRVQVGTAKGALAAGDYLMIRQVIEANKTADFRYGSASAKQVVLRFGFKAPAGTYSAQLLNGAAGNRSYIALFTITAGQANTDTEQIFIIPGDVTGTWLTDTSAGIILDICLAAGATHQGVAGWQSGVLMSTSTCTNGMATAGAVYELFDCGLYLDPLNSGVPPRWQMPDEAEELRACQRYWQRYVNWVVETGALVQTTTFLTEFRSAPAATGGGAGFSGYATTAMNTAVYQTARALQTLTFNARM